MKQTQTIRAGDARDAGKESEAPFNQNSILADSREVMKQYFKEKIAGLHLELDHLNFLDHPQEISRYCDKIMQLQKKLHSLEIKWSD